MLSAAGIAVAAMAVAWLRVKERASAEAMGQDYVSELRLELFDCLSAVSLRALARHSRGGTLLRFIGDLKALVHRGEIRVGVAHSQLMAGVYAGNSDEDLARCGYSNRDEVELKAPERLAEDLIDLIKARAKAKRERQGSTAAEVSITVALIGDSRTGKSETAEKMEGILSLNLI